MSIWGKIIGGTAGFALGGPIGGLIGALAGHAVDTYADKKDSDQDSTREVAFTIALIALSAKMAKADGNVTRDEILAFREKVDIPPDEIENVGHLWDLARRTPDGFDGYARQVAQMFEPGSPVLDQLMGLLFHIARADGELIRSEEMYLAEVAHILGYDEKGFERLTMFYGNNAGNPYFILGLDPDCTDEKIRPAWIALARDNHPDRLLAEGLPEEFIRAATDRLADINRAYDAIRLERGLS